MMKIFLWGMPGSGKSTLGRKLAAQLQLPFIDLDKVIEIQLGQSIASVFSAKGEEFFRKVERDTLLSAIDRHRDFVMATGGGAPCFFDNLQQMKKAGTTVFLNIPISRILQRMSAKGLAKRPLLSSLNQQDPEKEFNERFAYRMDFYQQAHHAVQEDDMHVSHIVSLLTAPTVRN